MDLFRKFVRIYSESDSDEALASVPTSVANEVEKVKKGDGICTI